MTELELMLMSIGNCRRIDLYVDRRLLNGHKAGLLEEMLVRRKSGEPLQYILGFSEFLGIRLRVDRRVFIPRPETELLVEAVLKEISITNGSLEILDIGTGSGNIAISLIKNIPDCRVTAIDISQDALGVASQNARLNQIEDKIELIQSDLFLNLRKSRREKAPFDIIVSNPPYIPTEEIARLPLDVRQEPNIALDGGSEGMNFYRAIIQQAPQFLKEGGLIFLEIGDGQKEAIAGIFAEKDSFRIKECIKDYCGTERVLIAELKNRWIN